MRYILKAKKYGNNNGHIPAMFLVMGIALTGCTNQPTAPEKIAPAFTPSEEFSQASCSDLTKTLGEINAREPAVVKQQKDRRSSSLFWSFVGVGVGDGDSMIAEDIARMRGQRLAIQQTMQEKHCP